MNSLYFLQYFTGWLKIHYKSQSMYTDIICAQNISYHFSRNQKVLDNLDLNVPAGSIYGFLGPNGAGKTTTLRLILGLLKIQQGNIELFGTSLRQNRISILKKTGSLIEQPSIYGHLTGKENLEIFRLTFGLQKTDIDRVLHIVGLQNAASKKTKAYSLGMKQRLSIAIALLHNPDLLILDEPTNGLDPAGIIETRELITSLNKNEGKTILVSSHILSEVEKMATHVAIIHKGKLLFQDSLERLQQFRLKQAVINFEVNDTVRATEILKNKTDIKAVNGRKISIGFKDKTTTALLNKILINEGIDVSEIHIQYHDLEKMFVEITSDTPQHK